MRRREFVVFSLAALTFTTVSTGPHAQRRDLAYQDLSGKRFEVDSVDAKGVWFIACEGWLAFQPHRQTVQGRDLRLALSGSTYRLS